LGQIKGLPELCLWRVMGMPHADWLGFIVASPCLNVGEDVQFGSHVSVRASLRRELHDSFA
jgi:hypothetical protein